jgi:hypothetical protein
VARGQGERINKELKATKSKRNFPILVGDIIGLPLFYEVFVFILAL